MSVGTTIPTGVEIRAPAEPRCDEILTREALAFLGELHRAFEPRRRELLAARTACQRRIAAGERPDFLPETRDIRGGTWQIAPLPAPLQRRRVEITGPVDRKMMINALNSGADAYMADFEDSNTPSWRNQLQGQINLKDAVRGAITLDAGGKHYRLNDTVATLLVRPRGWHLLERHVRVDGQSISGSLFDFGLAFFHNAREQIARGAGPYFYLPKLESRHEARLWNDVFVLAQEALGVPVGTIKATVLIETVLAAFQMHEILYELREHSAGLNAGRWDYIFSAIKKFSGQENFCLADRSELTMEAPFMRAYALELVRTCHCHGAPAIGGMSALIPIKNDPAANERALRGVRHDKARDARDGFDGGWVAHPGLVQPALDEFGKVLGNRPHQRDVVPPGRCAAADLLDFRPERPITEAGLRNDINVAIHYMGSWLAGAGCVPIHNLMEDAATAEIARSQVWQWVHSSKGVLNDGRKIDAILVRRYIAEELARIESLIGATGASTATYAHAARLLEELCLAPVFAEFLTLPMYGMLSDDPAV
ncbi:MAG: malate synthase A [Steroidobacteraceae bacterium]